MNPRPDIQKIPKQPLAVTAYETIVRKIICLEYPPSQHLEETRLMEDLGIGRTPIREALVRLNHEKMVEAHPNRGVIVRPITLQNTKSMFESMGLIELGLVDIMLKKDCSLFLDRMVQANKKVAAAIRENNVFNLVEANHQFHILFAKCSQNEFLIRAVADIRTEAKRLSYLSYDNIITPERPLETHYASVVIEHQEMISCLEHKKADRLKTLIQAHIDTFRERIVRFMTQ